jgi:hypothetical protein
MWGVPYPTFKFLPRGGALGLEIAHRDCFSDSARVIKEVVAILRQVDVSRCRAKQGAEALYQAQAWGKGVPLFGSCSRASLSVTHR